MDNFFYLIGWIGFCSVVYIVIGAIVSGFIIRLSKIDIQDYPALYKYSIALLWPAALIITISILILNAFFSFVLKK